VPEPLRPLAPTDHTNSTDHIRGKTTMHWHNLGIAVVFEITVALCAGKAEGFTRPAWTAATLISGGIGTYFLSLALLTFDVAVGYAIWTSVAGVGIVVLGALLFGQRLDWRKLLGISAVIIGVVGLQLSGAA
jgi:quaternary ammonium compound-resistance protein SugE